MGLSYDIGSSNARLDFLEGISLPKGWKQIDMGIAQCRSFVHEGCRKFILGFSPSVIELLFPNRPSSIGDLVEPYNFLVDAVAHVHKNNRVDLRCNPNELWVYVYPPQSIERLGRLKRLVDKFAELSFGEYERNEDISSGSNKHAVIYYHAKELRKNIGRIVLR